MATDQFVSVRESAQMLGVSEKKIMDMVESRQLQAYRIAGQFLRLKKSEVMNIQKSGDVAVENVQFNYTSKERLHDFFYYNDFYIASVIIILIFLYIVFYI